MSNSKSLLVSPSELLRKESLLLLHLRLLKMQLKFSREILILLTPLLEKMNLKSNLDLMPCRDAARKSRRNQAVDNLTQLAIPT